MPEACVAVSMKHRRDKVVDERIVESLFRGGSREVDRKLW
jgi:hypothetical protein